jgi:1-aminocyclopropane-1-carboxylate deaminase
MVAMVRGDYSEHPTPTLRDLQQWGVRLRYLSKLDYKKREENAFLQLLTQDYANPIVIPEGGSQASALLGVAELVKELKQQYDYIVAPVASGATLAGLALAVPEKTKVIGIAVLKGEQYLHQQVSRFLPKRDPVQGNWSIQHHYHFGGYAKAPSQLQDFCHQMSGLLQLPLEPIYSGKCLFALHDMIAHHYFPANSKILWLHTGGMQGARD